MKNNRLLKSTALILIVLVVGLFVGEYFLWKDIKSKNQKSSILENESILTQEREEYALSIAHKMTDTHSDLNKFNDSIVPLDGDVAFIEKLEKLGRENTVSVVITSLIFEDPSSLAASGVRIFKIRAKTKGSWRNTYSFFGELESLPQKIKLSSFSLSREEATETSSSLWNGEFEISVLKYK